MANILKRFTDIMSANINALLDKAEDPAKMVDQYIRDIESDLGNVKAETAAVMAAEKKAKRDLDENAQEMEKLTRYAEKALRAGNENDARVFLEKKTALAGQRQSLEQAYAAAQVNSDHMRRMHDKLEKDLAQLEQRRSAIKAKMAVAKTQEKMNQLGSSIGNAGETLSAFDKMEEKANRMLDEAEAMAELNQKEATAEDLMRKHDEPSQSSPEVEDELAALKAKLGL